MGMVVAFVAVILASTMIGFARGYDVGVLDTEKRWSDAAKRREEWEKWGRH